MEPDLTFTAHGSYVIGLCFTHDGKTLISCGMDALVKLWNTATWSERAVFSGHQKSVNGLSLSPDEQLLATSSSDTSVRLWSFPESIQVQALYDQKKVASGVAFSPAGKWLASIYYGGRAVIWDTSGQLQRAIKTGLKNLASLAFSPDGALLATGGLGGELALWSVPGGEPVIRLGGHEDAVLAVRFNRSGTLLLTMSYRGILRFWDTQTWELVRRWDIPGGRGFTLSPDERYIAFSAPSSVPIYSMDEGIIACRLSVATPVVNGISFSPDGSLFAAGAADRQIRIYQLE